MAVYRRYLITIIIYFIKLFCYNSHFIEDTEFDSTYNNIGKYYPLTDPLLQEKLDKNRKIQPGLSSVPSSNQTLNTEIDRNAIQNNTHSTSRTMPRTIRRTVARLSKNRNNIIEMEKPPSQRNCTSSDSEIEPEIPLGESKILSPSTASPVLNSVDNSQNEKKEKPSLLNENKNNIIPPKEITQKLSAIFSHAIQAKISIGNKKDQEESSRNSAQTIQLNPVIQETKESVISLINYPQKTIDEEEERIAQHIQEIFELQKEEENKKRAQLILKESEREASSSSSEDDYEFLFEKITESPEIMAEKIRKRLQNSHRFALLIYRLRKNEDFKNIVMQRRNSDLEKIQGCDLMLDHFFTTNKNPEITRTTLAQPKFTPVISLNPDFLQHQREEELFDNAPDSPRRLFQPNQLINRPQKESNVLGTNQILARNVTDVYSTQEGNLENLLTKSDKKFNKIFKKLNSDPIEVYERFAWLKEKLRIIEQIIQERQKEFDKLATMHNQEYSSVKSLGQALPPAALRRSSAGPEVRKKYKVNFDILNKREQMSQIDILERRYKMLSEKNQKISIPRDLIFSQRGSRGDLLSH